MILMFKLINAEMTQKKRERRERANLLELFDFVCMLCFVMKIGPF